MNNHISQIQGFWLARLLQGLLIFVASLVFLPVLWSMVLLFVTGYFQTIILSISNILFVTLKIYPRSFVTAFLIGLILAARSATWGTITFRFLTICSLVIIIFVDVVLRLYYIFGAKNLSLYGFGNEPFLYNLISWCISAMGLWAVLYFMGLTKRYNLNERARLHDACKAVIVYALYGPILYIIFYLLFVLGDDLSFLAASGQLAGQLTPATLIMSATMIVLIVRQLRRYGTLSWLWLLLNTIVISLAFCLLNFTAIEVSFDDWQNYLAAYVMTALSLSFIGGVTLRLMGVSFQHQRFIKSFKTYAIADSANKPTLQKQTLFAFAIIFLIAPPLWQVSNIMWRSILFGLPPIQYFAAHSGLNFLHVSLFLTLPLIIYGLSRRQIGFSTLFYIALFGTWIGSFILNNYLGVSFGYFYDHLGWGMLVNLPIIWLIWAFLSRIKTVEKSKKT